MLVFQVKLFATLAGGNAASFYQSYAIKGTQNVHHSHPICPTQNKMEGIVLFTFICSSIINSNPHVRKKIVAAVYKT